MQLHLRFFINYYLEYLSTFWNHCTIIGLSLKNGHVFLKKENLQIFQKISPIVYVTLKQQTLLFLIKSNRRNGQKPKRSDKRTSYQKYLHWQKSRPNTCTSTRNVFSKLYFEQSARYINSHLERQSDRDIPKLSYRSGMTALSKMSGQEIPGLCLLTIFSMGGMMGSENMHLD